MPARISVVVFVPAIVVGATALSRCASPSASGSCFASSMGLGVPSPGKSQREASEMGFHCDGEVGGVIRWLSRAGGGDVVDPLQK